MKNATKNTLLVAAGTVAAIAGSQTIASADTYTAKSGDTLYQIAKAHGTSVSELARINSITNTGLIFVGQEIKLSASSTATKTTTTSTTTTSTSTSKSVTVKAGDTLYAIAAAHNISAAELVSINKLANNGNLIYVGQTLKLSSSATTTTTTTKAVAATATAASTTTSTSSKTVSTVNTYPYGQCTWYVKANASWVGNYWGNANQWDTSARAAGYRVDNTAAKGAVVVFEAGQAGAGAYGHTAIVESVNGDGTITISEGNYAGLLYHTRTISAYGWTYIHQA